MVATKVYVINSSTLVAAVQRNHKHISFDPFITTASERLAGLNGPALELLREEHNGGQGVNQKILPAMHSAMLGDGLDKMNEKMIVFLKTWIDQLADSEGTVFDLHAWIRHAITVASTDAVWGPKNPYKSRDVEDAFWYVLLNVSIHNHNKPISS